MESSCSTFSTDPDTNLVISALKIYSSRSNNLREHGTTSILRQLQTLPAELEIEWDDFIQMPRCENNLESYHEKNVYVHKHDGYDRVFIMRMAMMFRPSDLRFFLRVLPGCSARELWCAHQSIGDSHVHVAYQYDSTQMNLDLLPDNYRSKLTLTRLPPWQKVDGPPLTPYDHLPSIQRMIERFEHPVRINISNIDPIYTYNRAQTITSLKEIISALWEKDVSRMDAKFDQSITLTFPRPINESPPFDHDSMVQLHDHIGSLVPLGEHMVEEHASKSWISIQPAMPTYPINKMQLRTNDNQFILKTRSPSS